MAEEIEAEIKRFILEEFLPGEDPAELTDTTPLITGAILDSIATLKVVMFIEERFNVTFAAHEVDRENFNTIENMARLTRSKLS